MINKLFATKTKNIFRQFIAGLKDTSGSMNVVSFTHPRKKPHIIFNGKDISQETTKILKLNKEDFTERMCDYMADYYFDQNLLFKLANDSSDLGLQAKAITMLLRIAAEGHLDLVILKKRLPLNNLSPVEQKELFRLCDIHLRAIEKDLYDIYEKMRTLFNAVFYQKIPSRAPALQQPV